MDSSSRKKKNILFVITKSSWGGATKYVHDLATHLPDDEYNVAVAAGGNGLLFEKLKHAHIETIPLSSLDRDVSIFSDIRTFFELYSIYKTRRPDIVHLNSSKAGFIGAFAARTFSLISLFSRKAPRIVFTAHGWAFHEDRPLFSRIFFFLLSWKIVLFSHRTIAVSTYVAEAMQRAPFIKKKVTTIPLGVTPPVLLPQDRARERLLGARARDFENHYWIGTIAELHKSKDIDTTLRALHLLRHIPYVYIIIGEGEQRQALEKKIQQLDLSERVQLVGFKDNATGLLSAFDLFVLSSTTEAFGYVVAEALLAAVPTVATAAGGIPEVVEHIGGYATLVPPKNYRALAEGIEETLTNPQETAAPDGYFIEAMVDNTVHLYRQLCPQEAVDEF